MEANVKKTNRHIALKAVIIVLVLLGIMILLFGILTLGTAGLLVVSIVGARVHVDSDPAHYSQYMGDNAKKEYRSKWGMDETIFPAELTAQMQVQDYKMVYYDPWDAQFLSHLTVTYLPDDYQAELERLAAYPSTEYKGYYGVTGFAGGEPLAVYADSYQGFVYAVSTPGKENSVTYAEIIFCNSMLDIDYTKYIPAEYLPDDLNVRVNVMPFVREAMMMHSNTDIKRNDGS